MIIFHDEDAYESVTTYQTCDFHLANPGKPFAACTCSAGFSQRRRTPVEIAKIKDLRRTVREDEILAEADEIRRRRGTP